MLHLFLLLCSILPLDARSGSSTACIANHKFNETTGKCEWTGPIDACLQTIDYHGRTGFVRMPYFPLQTWKEAHYDDGVFGNDIVTKVVVRRGCLYTGYSGYHEMWREIIGGNDNVGYGEYAVSGAGGDAGLSNLKCLCDPSEANLNNYVPKPPKNKTCIEHHEFDEETQQCEWTEDPKYCAELITFDARRQMVEIPDWPKNKKYDVDRWADAQIKAQNFHIQVTQAIVRQHCWLTMLADSVVGWNNLISRIVRNKRQLQTSGYGKHQVKSHYNGQYETPNEGARRVICECFR